MLASAGRMSGMSAAALSIRPARAHDARAIAAMSRDLIETGLDWKYDAQKIAALIGEPEVLSLVACDRQGLAGFAIMQFGDDRAHLLLLAVCPRCQRQGVARRLMQWLFASARVAGTAELSLELRAGNAAARAFYRALGFDDAGLVSGYYRNRESAIRMMFVLRSRSVEAAPWQPPTLRRR
jgi:ribosomal protein S18 acetylase RimI-like enzyme